MKGVKRTGWVPLRVKLKGVKRTGWVPLSVRWKGRLSWLRPVLLFLTMQK